MTVALSSWQFQTLVGLTGFNEKAFVSHPGVAEPAVFANWYSRCTRYDIYWSHFEGNVYRRIHQFQPELKAEYDLYSATRTVFSPAYRLGEFWSEHLMGGRLDPDAGDGTLVPSALPIKTKSPKAAALRKVVALILGESNWQEAKDNWTRFGAVLGDVGAMPVDDPVHRKVYMKVIHPRIVREVTLDSRRNCKSYVFQEQRIDPRLSVFEQIQYVTYTEVAERVGDRVEYATYLNQELYDWRDYPYDDTPRVGPTWTEDYGFIPFIWHQHRDMGLGAGWSELHPSLSKMMELDDIASKIDDQARKLVDCPWFFSGTEEADLVVSYGPASDDDHDPVRTKIPYICSTAPDAKPTPLVAQLDLKAASEHCMQILNELERDHMELQTDVTAASGSASGRALRVARERVEAMVETRRAGYDAAFIRLLQMCISIGAMKKYPGFEDFDENSFANGDLDMSVGDRPVFAVDAMDRIEMTQAQSQALANMTGAGMPLLVAMEIVGFPQAMIDKARKEQKRNEAKALALAGRRVAAAGGALALQNGKQGKNVAGGIVGSEHLPGAKSVKANSQTVDQPGKAP